MKVEYAKGWDLDRVEAQADTIPKTGMVLGFKAPSTYVSKERLDAAFANGAPIRRKRQDEPTFPCSERAVHVAVHLGHDFVERGVDEHGVLYLASMNAHGLHSLTPIYAKWYGNQYWVVARIEDPFSGGYRPPWSRWSFLEGRLREVEK